MNTKINPICFLPIHEYVKEIIKAAEKLSGIQIQEEIDFGELEKKQKERDKGAYEFVKIFKDIP